MDIAPTPKNTNRRALHACVAAACLALTLLGLSRISFDVDILKMLPQDLPQVRGLGLFLKNFSQSDQLILTVEADSPEAADQVTEAIAQRLQARPELTRLVVSKSPWESSPADLGELAAYLSLNSSQETFAALHARLAPAQRATTLAATLERIGESISPQEVTLASYDPFGIVPSLSESGLLSRSQSSEFSSADGTFRVLYVYAPQPLKNYKAAIAWIAAIKQAVQEWRSQPGITLGFTGEPSFVADISGAMEWDMSSSSFVTLVLIALVFLACYRRATPLFGLQLMLALIFALTLGAAGLFLKQLTVIGVGCAAIMIGLSVDYGYFIFQRSLQHSGTVSELRAQCWQYIAWTSGTTAAAFFSLNLSSLPGLSQLGNLVGFGVVIGASVMQALFAPLALSYRRKGAPQKASGIERLLCSPSFAKVGFALTLTLTTFLLGALCLKGFPKMEFAPGYLRPRQSDAYTALERLSAKLMDTGDLLHLVVEGNSEREVWERLQKADRFLSEAKAQGQVATFLTPLLFWPNPAAQEANLAMAGELARDKAPLREAVLEAGFTDQAFGLTEQVLGHWQKWALRPDPTLPLWPESPSSQWILGKISSRSPGRFLAAGAITPNPGQEDVLIDSLNLPGTFIVGWPQLGKALQKVVPREIVAIICTLSVLVLLLLAFALRSARALLCFVLGTALVFACLAGVMSLMGMTWNIFNLAALLLLLGTGTDYSILILLSLRRNGGDLAATQKELFLVIGLCASSAAAGFGTIGWANHLGLAVLGQTCAIGLGLDALISLFLLPPAWKALQRLSAPSSRTDSGIPVSN